MSFEQIASLIDEAACLAKGSDPVVGKMSFLIYPELACAPRFLDLAGKMCEHGSRFGGNVPTNGYTFARGPHGEAHIRALFELGTEGVQLALHGQEAHHDWFVRRQGAFQDILRTAELCFANGGRVGWQVFLDHRNGNQIESVKDLIRDISPEGRYAIRVMTASYSGNAKDHEQLRPVIADTDLLADGDKQAILGYYQTEAHRLARLRQGTQLKVDLTDLNKFFWVLVDPDFIVRREEWPNEPVGDLRSQSLRDVVTAYGKRTEKEKLIAQLSQDELADRYGDPHSQKLYSATGLWIKWVEACLRDREN